MALLARSLGVNVLSGSTIGEIMTNDSTDLETQRLLAELQDIEAVDLGAALDVTRNGSGSAAESRGRR